MNKQETSPWAILPYLLPGIKSHSKSLAYAIFCMFGSVCLRLVEPWPLQIVLDNVLSGIPAPSFLESLVDWLSIKLAASHAIALLTICSFSIVAIALVRAGMDYFRTVAFTLIGNSVISDLRARLYRHLQTLSLDFHSRARAGDLTVRLTSDVSMLKDVTVSAALPLVSSALLLCGMLTVMLWMNWQLALIIVAAMPFFVWITFRTSRRIHDSARKQRKREGALASTAAENLAAVKSLQAQGQGLSTSDSFTNENKKSNREGAKTSRLMAKLERSVDVQIALVTALILWFGTRLVLDGSLTAGELVVYLAYLKRGFKPLQDFAKYTGRLSKAIAAGERIAELLKEQPEIVEPASATLAPALQGTIAFDDVSFSYVRANTTREASLPTLRNLSFLIDAGQHVAIVGPSGIGKSTLLSLILRLREASSGCIRMDGVDIRSWKIDSLRQQVSVVLQENCIFATSIRENIAMFCPHATEEQIISAAKTASAHEFILRLSNGYETLIGERGVDLSQGQLQRLAIARAALRDVPILLLDEPTCNLDAENRAHVISSLRNVAAGRTTLMVTHDLDLAKQCDKVLYIGQNYQSMYGTHDELMRTCRAYEALMMTSTGTDTPSREKMGSLV